MNQVERDLIEMLHIVVQHMHEKNIYKSAKYVEQAADLIERQAAELPEARKVDVSAIFKAIADLTMLPEDDCERIRRYDVMTQVIKIRAALTGGKDV